MTMSDNSRLNEAIMIERIFDAPVDVVWKLWTQPDLFKQWYAPEGFKVPVAEMDIRVGGKNRFCMEQADGGMKIWTTGEYKEVVPNQRLVYTEHMVDDQGNVLKPGGDDYPETTVITIRLEDLNGRTKMIMTHAGLPAGAEDARGGWNQAFDKLAEMVRTFVK
jgi:uncharacterized protein YndB with AHSA1/START domain